MLSSHNGNNEVVHQWMSHIQQEAQKKHWYKNDCLTLNFPICFLGRTPGVYGCCMWAFSVVAFVSHTSESKCIPIVIIFSLILKKYKDILWKITALHPSMQTFQSQLVKVCQRGDKRPKTVFCEWFTSYISIFYTKFYKISGFSLFSEKSEFCAKDLA